MKITVKIIKKMIVARLRDIQAILDETPNESGRNKLRHQLSGLQGLQSDIGQYEFKLEMKLLAENRIKLLGESIKENEKEIWKMANR
jgi:hypothetical protein